jgi:CRP-like cAMP-binding protein
VAEPAAPSIPRKGYLELPLLRMSKIAALAPAEQAAVRALNGPRRTTAKGSVLVWPETSQFHFVLDGWACRQREIAPGRRQLFDLILPGDVVGRLPDAGPIDDSSCVALTSVITIDATALARRDVQGQFVHPGIMSALGQLRGKVQRRLMDHVVRLGAHSAYDGLAHLLLELHERLADVGLASSGRMPFPLGYERVGELLGLSEVHVGRTLAKLKADGHLEIGPGWLVLPRIDDLARQVHYA